MNYRNVYDACLIRADVNGDGIIGLSDVFGAVINSTKASHNYSDSDPSPCPSLPRASDRDLYYNELKKY